MAVWTQGCSIKCKGCFNPELWGTNGGDTLEIDELWQRISEQIQAFPVTEGITVMGGEPFDQPKALSSLAKTARIHGQSVVVFTGFTLIELTARRDTWTGQALQHIDVLIDGRFEQNKVDKSRPWLGSTNQNYNFLSDRYSINDMRGPDRIEINVAPRGGITINGWAGNSDLDDLLRIISD